MRYPIQYIAIHRDKCTQSFGVGVCEATGEKCFNTIGTCKFLTAYERTTQVDYFVNPDNTDASIYAQIGDSVYPFLVSVGHKPATINPASAQTGSTALGTRATLSISLRDAASDDRYQDKYFFERGGNPNELGTFFGKYFARNKYLWGRQVDWVNAYIEGGLIVDKHTRTYVVTATGGPDSSGSVTMSAQDVLVLTNASKAKYPPVSDVRLFQDITETQTTLTVILAEVNGEAPGTSLTAWPNTGYIRIGDEIMSYTKAGGLNLTIGRAKLGSEAEAHELDSTVQLVASIVSKKPWEIIQQILTDGTTIPASMLDIAQWQTESSKRPWMQQNYTAYLSDPTGVNDLLADISQQMMFFPYFDEESNTIKIKGTTSDLESVESVKELNCDEHFIESSFTRKKDDAAVVTRVYSHTGVRNWANDLKERDNFRAVIVLITGEEGDDRRRHASSADVYGYWLNDEQSDLVGRMILRQFGEAGYEYRFKLDAKDTDIKLADFVTIRHRLLVDAYGRPQAQPAQITQAKESIMGTAWEYMATNYPFYPLPDFEGNYFVSIPVSTYNVNLEQLFKANRPGAYDKIKSGDVVTFILGNNVVIGSTNAANASLSTGNWPAGVNLVIDCSAGGNYIDGAGGKGGRGAGSSSWDPTEGEKGGDAVALSYALVMVGAPTLRGGGGGGGGGGRARGAIRVYAGGGGGGGGQGRIGGDGGIAGPTEMFGGTVSKHATDGIDGSLSSGGTGGRAGVGYSTNGNYYEGGSGGNGAGWATAGTKGADGVFAGGSGTGVYTTPGMPGGAAGRAVVGNSFLTAPDAIFVGARV